jgi:cytochrome P450
MPKSQTVATFSRDPLGFMDARLEHDGDVLRTGPGEYLLGDPLAAREVLHNAEGRYREHSDFFHTRYGLFGPRSAQLKMRREARELLRAHLQRCDADALSALAAAELSEVSDWPDAGNRLARAALAPLLLAPDSPPQLHTLIEKILARAVFANARARQPRWRRMLLQFETTWRLCREIEQRQRLARPQPLDLLDVVANAIEPDERLDQLAEVYLSFLFAIAGSVGFVLGWSLYLSCSHRGRTVPSAWIVQEALRLWPVAWQLGRHPANAHDVSGTHVDAGDEIVVCPYLVQRHPGYWDAPTEFRPERWSDPGAWRNPAFIPFGHGPHRCIAADLSPRLIAALYDAISAEHALSIEVRDPRPTIAAAMAPPAFRLIRRAAAGDTGSNPGDAQRAPATGTRARGEPVPVACPWSNAVSLQSDDTRSAT